MERKANKGVDSNTTYAKWVGTAAFFLALGIVEFFFVFYNPPYASPDELSHLQYATYLKETLKLPDPYQENKIQQDKHPPYIYAIGALLLREGGKPKKGRSIQLPGPFEHPIDLSEISEGSGITNLGLLILRSVMALHWIIGGFFLYKLSKLIWPAYPLFSFGVAIGFSTIPQIARIGASFSPDSPLMAFSAITFYFFASLLKKWSTKKAFLAGIFLSLSLLSKSAAICLLPLPLMFPYLRENSGSKKVRIFDFFFIYGVPAILAGWWYLRNLLLFGDPFQIIAQTETFAHSLRRSPITPAFFEVFFEDLWRTFFGFDTRETLLPHPLYYLFAGAIGVAISGTFLISRRTVREEVGAFPIKILFLGSVCFLLMLLLTFFGNLSFHSPQGRYLFPAVSGALVFCGIGWRTAFRMKKRDSPLSAILGIGVAILSITSFNYSFLPHFFPQKSRIQGAGGEVYFYEDCGTPKLHPHRLQGFDIPDGSQEGRVVPWRTLDGHPLKITYRFPLTKKQKGNLQVRVLYFNPDPRTPFAAREKGHFEYPTQRLLVNGVLIHEEIEITSTPKLYVFPISSHIVSKNLLELSFEKVRGPAATVAEIWIEKRWLSLLKRKNGIYIQNHSSLNLDCLLSFNRERQKSWVRATLFPGFTPLNKFYSPLPEGNQSTPLICLTTMSPWRYFQAESFPQKGVKWFGGLKAEGGYFLRGTQGLCVLPKEFFEDIGKTTVLYRTRKKRRSWTWNLAEKAGVNLHPKSKDQWDISPINKKEGLDLDSFLLLVPSASNQLKR